MTINDLKVGDLLVFGPRWSAGADGKDIGIVLEVEPCTEIEDRVAEAVIYWQNEEVKPNSFDASELDDWLGRGLCRVASGNR